MSALCMDCTAERNGRKLIHDETCPSARALDQICDADRQFFDDHPAAPRYWRPMSSVEFQDLRSLGEVPDGCLLCHGRVRVTKITGGVRAREFFWRRFGQYLA